MMPKFRSLEERRERVINEFAIVTGAKQEEVTQFEKKFGPSIDLYDDRFDAACLFQLLKLECSPEKANRFNPRFECLDVVTIVYYGCSAEQANQYPEELSPWRVPMAAYLGIKPEHITTNNKSVLVPLIHTLCDNHETITTFGIWLGPFQYLNSGAQGFLFMSHNQKYAFKVVNGISEYRLLQEVKDKNEELKNVIALQGCLFSSKNTYVIILDYIFGKSIQELLTSKSFNEDQTTNYIQGIFNGLQELRRAGIYHRDLWLGNIMIDEVKDRAVIIDLGISTNDSKDGPKDNRRYGGENDLQSLGQIMYKMATGRHLFNPTINTSTHLIPEEVKKERERVYSDPATLETRLRQVESSIPDKHLADIIKICLKAKGTEEEYKTLEERFKVSS